MSDDEDRNIIDKYQDNHVDFLVDCDDASGGGGDLALLLSLYLSLFLCASFKKLLKLRFYQLFNPADRNDYDSHVERIIRSSRDTCNYITCNDNVGNS